MFKIIPPGIIPKLVTNCTAKFVSPWSGALQNLRYNRLTLCRRFRPSPCPNHYDGHLATMPSADFYLITALVTQNSAIGFHLVRSPLSMASKEPRHLLTRASLVSYRSPVKQISPDKGMNCYCATASFTVAVRSLGFDVLCHLASSLRLI